MTPSIHASLFEAASSVGRRRGAVLVAALVCIAVASLMFLAILRTAVAQRNAVRTEAWRQQAVWLAESGLGRAAAKLAADPDYQGETWIVPAEQFSSDDGAVVTIEIEPLAGEPNRRLVRARADFPDHPQHRARRTKQAVIETGPSL